jgi:3'(2'), 5'-bisphosphate nucleotidase
MTYHIEKETAINAVTQAAQLCTLVRQAMVGQESIQKDDKSPVTIADFGAQALVCQILKATFPADPIVGEEDSAALQTDENQAQLQEVLAYVQKFHPHADKHTICRWIDGGNGQVANRYWTLDPIDGTKGFLRNDQYAVALALFEDGEIKVGALACPALPVDMADPEGECGVLFVAVRGEGTQMKPLNGTGAFKTVQVASSKDTSRLRFAESVVSAHGDQDRQRKIAQAVGITSPPLRMDSQAKYGAVARGDASLYLRLPSPKYPGYREKIWDHAAGAIIVEEAGGTVTDMHGQPLDFASDYLMHNNQGVIVSNSHRHQAVIEALSE